MRAVRLFHFVLAVLMLIFMFVQINDPDGWQWFVIYAVPMIWASLAAFRPQALRHIVSRILLAISILLATILAVFYWPRTDAWWTRDIWWEVESVREGMGMMIVLLVLVSVSLCRLAVARVGKGGR